jgi:hypothetical protein
MNLDVFSFKTKGNIMRHTNFSKSIAAVAGACALAASAADGAVTTVLYGDSTYVLSMYNSLYFSATSTDTPSTTSPSLTLTEALMNSGFFGSSWYLMLSATDTATFRWCKVGDIVVSDVISSSTTWADPDSSTSWYAALTTTSSFSVGDKFYLAYKDTSSGTTYGYVELKCTSTANYGSLAVIGYAYDLTGAEVMVIDLEAVPEPATFGLFGGALALGAAGLYRRRKTA